MHFFSKMAVHWWKIHPVYIILNYIIWYIYSQQCANTMKLWRTTNNFHAISYDSVCSARLQMQSYQSLIDYNNKDTNPSYFLGKTSRRCNNFRPRKNVRFFIRICRIGWEDIIIYRFGDDIGNNIPCHMHTPFSFVRWLENRYPSLGLSPPEIACVSTALRSTTKTTLPKWR